MRYCLDLDFLDCPICEEPFSPPVYQCANGHSVCSSWCQKNPQQTCPSCSQPTGKIRSLMVEKILESMQVPCKHEPHGCFELFHYSKTAKRRKHEEELCNHKPFPCPYPSCLRKGSSLALPSHLAEAHGVQRMQVDPRKYAKFRMPNDGFMMVDLGNDGLMLVHRVQHNLGDIFVCTTIIGTSHVYNLKVKSTSGTSICTIEASARHIHKVLERSRVPNDGLLIIIAKPDINKPWEYDVKVEVRETVNFPTNPAVE